MGLAIRELHLTNIGDESGDIVLSKWIPELREDGKYYQPKDTPMGYDMWVPNIIDLKKEDGTIPVDIVESKEETGLWLVCYDDYFGSEQHLYAFKPKFKVGEFGRYKLDHNVEGNYLNSLHVGTDIKMKAGDGPIPVTFKRKEWKIEVC